MRIVISSGHGKYVRGASGYLDEVDEARKVVTRVAEYLRDAGHQVDVFHDDTSTTQSENLDTIVNYHNAQTRDLDVSVHFNAYITTSEPMGCEVLYKTQADLAERVSAAIAAAGHFIDRGPKKRTDLAFLNGTEKPAILIETCFVDSATDAKMYNTHFDAICQAIAGVSQPTDERPQPPAVDAGEALARFSGPVSWFGGPDDEGVSESEELAFLYEYDDAPHLFLDNQPPGTTGLARRLNPDVFYVACRWDYDVTPKEMLADQSKLALVKTARGRMALAWPADWGPHEDTGRAADISPGLMDALLISTDDEVTVSYPVRLPR